MVPFPIQGGGGGGGGGYCLSVNQIVPIIIPKEVHIVVCTTTMLFGGGFHSLFLSYGGGLFLWTLHKGFFLFYRVKTPLAGDTKHTCAFLWGVQWCVTTQCVTVARTHKMCVSYCFSKKSDDIYIIMME